MTFPFVSSTGTSARYSIPVPYSWIPNFVYKGLFSPNSNLVFLEQKTLYHELIIPAAPETFFIYIFKAFSITPKTEREWLF